MAKNKKKLAVGVDLGGTFIKFGLVTEKGEIIEKISLDTRAEQGVNAVLKQIKTGVGEITNNWKTEIIGVGIGVPGLVTKNGEICEPPNLPGWDKVPIKKRLEKEFNCEVHVENDANAATIGELIFGAGQKFDNFIMLTLGTGVGGGIILNNKIYRGEIGAAGEFGHTTIDYNGNACNCGSTGCVESYVGNNYLVSRVKKQLVNETESIIFSLIDNDLDKLTPKVISQAASYGDPFAQRVIVETGRYLGYSVASILNILDVSKVIIGGGVSGFGDILFKSVEQTIKERVFKAISERLQIIPAELKNDAGILGASALVYQKV